MTTDGPKLALNQAHSLLVRLEAFVHACVCAWGGEPGWVMINPLIYIVTVVAVV
jgi:hypothetical protein